MSKIFFPTLCVVVTPIGMISVEFHEVIWCQKSRLWCSIGCMVYLAVLIELGLVSDTDRDNAIAYTE